MNGKDKISVIIPCYNVQKYIMRCFDSIYSQTYGFENLEVILIDDLSTDNTWSILESLQIQYPENVISLKIQKKGKCGGVRNLGMDICTGKYITFVDADDYVHPDMLRVLHDRMTEDDYDVAQCGVSCFKADKPNVLEVNDFEIQRLDLDNVDNRKNLIIGLTGFTNVTAWAKLYSTKFIIEHNLRFVLPPIFGYHTYLSGTDHTGNISKYGSVVYLKTIDEASYKDGNIVAIESADSSARRVDSYYVDSNDSSAKEIALRDGNGVSYKVVKGQVIAKTPFIGYLSQLCFSAVGIIVTVVIFAAGVAIMMYVNKISKEINTMVEQQTA